MVFVVFWYCSQWRKRAAARIARAAASVVASRRVHPIVQLYVRVRDLLVSWSLSNSSGASQMATMLVIGVPILKHGARLTNACSTFFNSISLFSEQLRYRFLQVLSMPIYGRLVAILLLGLFIVVAGSMLYRTATGCTWPEAIARSYYVLNNVPGVDVINEPSPRARLVLNVLVIVSLFSFAVVIGMVADEIGGSVSSVRSGNFPVPESGHTVVLGSGRLLVHVLRQVFAAQSDRGEERLRSPVLVLSSESKDELDQRLEWELGDQRGLVLTRQGSPMKASDLDRVAAGRARTVIMLRPDDSVEVGPNDLSVEAQQAVTLATLQAIGSVREQTIVVQRPKDAELLGRSRELFDVWGDEGVAKETGLGRRWARQYEVAPVADVAQYQYMMAQCAVQPGLSYIFDMIFAHSGQCELYIQRYEGPEVLKYGEARRRFPNATVIGGIFTQDPNATGNGSSAVTTTTGGAGKVLQFSSSRRAAAGRNGGGSGGRELRNGSGAGNGAAAAAGGGDGGGGASPTTYVSNAGGKVLLNPSDSCELREGDSLVLLAPSHHDLDMSATPREPAVLPEDLLAPIIPPKGLSSKPPPPNAKLRGAAATTTTTSSSTTSTTSSSSPLTKQQQQQLLQHPHSSASSMESAHPRRGHMRRLLKKKRLAEIARGGTRYVVLCHDDDPQVVLEGLEDFVPAGTPVTVVSRKPIPHNARKTTSLDITYLSGNLLSQEVLRGAGIPAADSVIMTGMEWWDSDRADAQVLALLLELRRCLIEAPVFATHKTVLRRGPLHVVACVSNPRTCNVLMQVADMTEQEANVKKDCASCVTLDLLQPEKLSSGILVQVAAEPQLQDVFRDLFDAEGSEIYLRTADNYGLPTGVPLTWVQVQDAVRLAGETAMGRMHDSNKRLELSPAAGSKHAFNTEDVIVVLAEERAGIDVTGSSKVSLLSGDFFPTTEVKPTTVNGGGGNSGGSSSKGFAAGRPTVSDNVGIRPHTISNHMGNRPQHR